MEDFKTPGGSLNGTPNQKLYQLSTKNF